MNYLMKNRQTLGLLFFQGIIFLGTLIFNFTIIKVLYPAQTQMLILIISIIYGFSLITRHGWEMILIRYLPDFIKRNDLYSYKLVKKKSIFDIIKNSFISILILSISVYGFKKFFDISIFNNLVNFIYTCCLIVSFSLHVIFKSIIQSYKRIKLSFLSEIGFVFFITTSIIIFLFYLNISLSIELILSITVITSVLINLFNFIVIFFLEKNTFYNSNKNKILIKKFEISKIIPSYFLNTLSNYIFEWSIFFVFFILNLKNLSDIFFAAMQAKFFISFFGVAFIRKYIHDFSINLKENNINKLNKILKIFNKYVFIFSIIILIFFILFNQEYTLFMYKTSLNDINIMCLLFVIFEFIYLLFGCPQSIGMLSKHDYFFSKINFGTSILYFLSLFVTIYFFEIWGAIFTFGFFYIIKNIIGSFYVFKKIKVVTVNIYLLSIFK